jgi:hypothetical protein
MAGGPSQHHVDRLGYCLGDCSGASDLASTSCGVIEGGSGNFRISAAYFAMVVDPCLSNSGFGILPNVEECDESELFMDLSY